VPSVDLIPSLLYVGGSILLYLALWNWVRLARKQRDAYRDERDDARTELEVVHAALDRIGVKVEVRNVSDLPPGSSRAMWSYKRLPYTT
jgi:hypothetical protein